MQGIALDSKQKKMIIAGAVAAVVAVVFTITVYSPYKKQSTKIKADMAKVDQEIKDLQAKVDKTRASARDSMFRSEFKQTFQEHFPTGEKEALKKIFDLAKVYDIKLGKVNPGPKEVFNGIDGQPAAINNKTCQRIAISLDMRCNFRTLTNYLSGLNNEFPGAISVESLTMNRDPEAGSGGLSVLLKINFYFLG